MLRDGFLVVGHSNDECEDKEGSRLLRNCDPRSPAAGWRHTGIQCPIITFGCEQNLVVTLYICHLAHQLTVADPLTLR